MIVLLDDPACLLCGHAWSVHTKGDQGPCMHPGGCEHKCPHFRPIPEKITEVEVFRQALRALKKALNERWTELLAPLCQEYLGSNEIEIKYMERDYEWPPKAEDSEYLDLSKVRWYIVVDGLTAADTLWGEEGVIAWLSGIYWVLRQLVRKRTDPISRTGKSLVQEALVLLALPAEGRQHREARWRELAKAFLSDPEPVKEAEQILLSWLPEKGEPEDPDEEEEDLDSEDLEEEVEEE